ncbi:hypothetical protein, partial [Escherichia coli]|uniref:hypothetical protein n=1 Tax=Escherichia coli TaxID=562 RepID=UPI001412FCC3
PEPRDLGPGDLMAEVEAELVGQAGGGSDPLRCPDTQLGHTRYRRTFHRQRANQPLHEHLRGRHVDHDKRGEHHRQQYGTRVASTDREH